MRTCATGQSRGWRIWEPTIRLRRSCKLSMTMLLPRCGSAPHAAWRNLECSPRRSGATQFPRCSRLLMIPPWTHRATPGSSRRSVILPAKNCRTKFPPGERGSAARAGRRTLRHLSVVLRPLLRGQRECPKTHVSTVHAPSPQLHTVRNLTDATGRTLLRHSPVTPRTKSSAEWFLTAFWIRAEHALRVSRHRSSERLAQENSPGENREMLKLLPAKTGSLVPGSIRSNLRDDSPPLSALKFEDD